QARRGRHLFLRPRRQGLLRSGPIARRGYLIRFLPARSASKARPLLALRAGGLVTMKPIDALFQRLRHERRKAFIPFATGGDPDVAGTVQLIEELARRGASLIEIGFPYSDPIADGPVIQASYTRVLDRGFHLDDVFACARRASERLNRATPLVAMLSYSIVH